MTITTTLQPETIARLMASFRNGDQEAANRQKADLVEVLGGEGRYMIRMKGAPPDEKLSAKSEEAIPILRDVSETHRLKIDNGALADELAEQVRQERPSFDPREYGFQQFSELLKLCPGQSLVRIVTDEKRGLLVYLGAEFHPPAPSPEPTDATEIEEEEYEPQPQRSGEENGARPAYGDRRDSVARTSTEADASPARA